MLNLKQGYPDKYINNPEFYLSVAKNPDSKILVIMGIDDECRSCGNFDGKKCTLYTEKELLFEDRRTFDEFFPFLVVGKYTSISDIVNS